MAKKSISITQLNKMDERRRLISLRQSIKSIKDVLSNSEGWQRLRAITPEEWKQAEGQEGE